MFPHVPLVETPRNTNLRIRSVRRVNSFQNRSIRLLRFDSVGLLLVFAGDARYAPKKGKIIYFPTAFFLFLNGEPDCVLDTCGEPVTNFLQGSPVLREIPIRGLVPIIS